MAQVIGKCKQCGKGVSANTEELNETAHRMWSRFRWLMCLCGTRVTVKFLSATVGTRECGEYCTEGTGATCKCSCGGASHGLAWRVK